jgi:hypothetical protein
MLGMLGAVSVSAQTNVYSLNAVGYINITCPPGYSLITFSLFGSPNNDPAIMLDNTSGVYDGSEILLWTNGDFLEYIGDHNAGNDAVNGWLEPDGAFSVNPGLGAAFYNPAKVSCNITIVGTVLEGAMTNYLNSGLNLVGSILPASGGLITNPLTTFPSSANGQLDGDEIYVLFNTGAFSGYTTYTADSLSFNSPANYGWDGPAGATQPIIPNVGESFWYRAGNQPVQWTQQYYVTGTPPSTDLARTQNRKPAKLLSPAIAEHRHFQARIKGEVGKRHVVEVSHDLKTWKPVATNLLSSATWLYKETEPATNACRYYRAFTLR